MSHAAVPESDGPSVQNTPDTPRRRPVSEHLHEALGALQAMLPLRSDEPDASDGHAPARVQPPPEDAPEP